MLVWLISWNDLSLHHVFSCSLLVIIRSCEWSDGPPEEGATQSQAFTPSMLGNPGRGGARTERVLEWHQLSMDIDTEYLHYHSNNWPAHSWWFESGRRNIFDLRETAGLWDSSEPLAANHIIQDLLQELWTWHPVNSGWGNTLVRVRGCAILQLATLLIYLSNVFFLKDIIIQGLIHISFVNKYINKYSRRNQSVLIKRSTGDTYSDTGNPVVQGPIGTGCINDIAGLTRSGNLSDGGLSSWRYCLT